MSEKWKKGDYALDNSSCQTCPNVLRLTTDVDLNAATVHHVQVQTDQKTGERILVLL